LRIEARPGDVLLLCAAHTRSAEAVETLKTARRIGLTTWAVAPRPARAIALAADDLIEVDCSPDLIESAHEAILRIVETLVDGDVRRFGRAPGRRALTLSPPQAARPGEDVAHTALLDARSIVAATMRDVLRELYPAALRAYADPTEPVPLAILEALPEPGTVDPTAAHGWEEAAAVLADAGVADIETLTDQITSLRVAIAETPRRVRDTALYAATAHTVRQSIAAVRACDKAIAALATLPARMTSSPNRVAAAPAGLTQEGRVVPPWQADDLPAESPTLRLVEPAPAADPLAPPRLLLSPDPLGVKSQSGEPSVEPSADSDLLIFAACRSAWFTDSTDESEEQLEWASAADMGWDAASQAASPAAGSETTAGLPRRVPQRNLVPGSAPASAEPEAEQRPLRIVRDAAAIAAHTSGYFNGYRRGQEVGGNSAGDRPGRESSVGWDFTRESSAEDGYVPRGSRSDSAV